MLDYYVYYEVLYYILFILSHPTTTTINYYYYFFYSSSLFLFFILSSSIVVAQSPLELMGLISTNGKMGAIYATAQASGSPTPSQHFHLVLLLGEARQERIVLHAATLSNLRAQHTF